MGMEFGPKDPRFFRRPPLELERDEWTSERNEPKARPKYPRKTWFGLTDYGPPPITWQLVLSILIAKAAMVLLLRG
jgi:hypothetical protein